MLRAQGTPNKKRCPLLMIQPQMDLFFLFYSVNIPSRKIYCKYYIYVCVCYTTISYILVELTSDFYFYRIVIALDPQRMEHVILGKLI